MTTEEFVEYRVQTRKNWKPNYVLRLSKRLFGKGLRFGKHTKPFFEFNVRRYGPLFGSPKMYSDAKFAHDGNAVWSSFHYIGFKFAPFGYGVSAYFLIVRDGEIVPNEKP